MVIEMLLLKATDFPKDTQEKQFMLSEKLKSCFYEVIKTMPNEWAFKYAKDGLEVDWRNASVLKLHAQKVLTNLKFVNSFQLVRTKQLLAEIIQEIQQTLR